MLLERRARAAFQQCWRVILSDLLEQVFSLHNFYRFEHLPVVADVLRVSFVASQFYGD